MRASLTPCLVFAAAALIGACGGTTGSDTFLFEAAAGGVERDPSQPFAFDETDGRGRAWHVVLTRALLTVGPVYLNNAVLVSQAQETSCFRHGGRYVGEVLSTLQVDALSPALTFFPSAGRGVADQVRTAEVWLFGDESNLDGTTPILDVAGTATSELGTFPFEGTVALTKDWLRPADPSSPGQNQLCEIRQATNIPAEFHTAYGGGLIVRIEPSRWFDKFDFSELKPAISAGSDAGPGNVVYVLGKSPSDDFTTRILVENLRARTGVYSLQWVSP
ncbi:MAG: hypothetical protein HY898_00040 [Deltaproteobacteria bacterium]|nr:hypothetical protein [Deltaproteobacteria bacterium]